MSGRGHESRDAAADCAGSRPLIISEPAGNETDPRRGFVDRSESYLTGPHVVFDVCCRASALAFGGVRIAHLDPPQFQDQRIADC